MYTKTIYVIIDCLAIIDIIFTLRAIRGLQERSGRRLYGAMLSAIFAILANIMIALSPGPLFAEVSYCIYFSAIDWIIFFICGFCMHYTEHHDIMRKMAVPAAIVMGLDTLSIFFNLVFGHQFYIYKNIRPSGVVFYQTGFYAPYYLHLAVDYISIIVALFFIILRIVKSYSFYRIKYVIILSVLLFVILLNVAYMMFSLVLDASVVFYAVAGTLIYFCISVFVPRRLMNASIGRAVDEMSEGLILFDVSNTCIYANSFSRQQFGIDVNTCDFSCEPIRTIIMALRENHTEYGETTYVKADPENDSRHYRVRYNKLSDGKGRSIGSFFLIKDETEEVYYLNKIKEAKNEADDANRAKSSFLASMSHEIRTPLNSVLGMNEMILRSTDDPEIRDYAGSIRMSGETLLSLINDILDFSKIEANRMELVVTEYNLHDILRDCYHYFEQASFSKDLYIHIQCAESMPVKIAGDENRIRQILSNLLSNAVKYTSTGGVEISASTAYKEDGILLTFRVSDTGIGIDRKDLPYLFDAFRRVNEKQTANIQGTGLGLAITKDLVDIMHGSISVESEVGKGTTFTVTIPQGIADKTAAGPFRLLDGSEKDYSYKEQFTAETAHILVVDDVPLNLKLICALLKKTMVQVDTADGGNAAISMCKDTKYDVILLDHRMPDPDGIATFEEIRRDGVNKETPVVMLTANALSGAKEEYMGLGFDAYLSKPIRSEELEATLLKLLPEDKVQTV